MPSASAVPAPAAHPHPADQLQIVSVLVVVQLKTRAMLKAAIRLTLSSAVMFFALRITLMKSSRWRPAALRWWPTTRARRRNRARAAKAKPANRWPRGSW